MVVMAGWDAKLYDGAHGFVTTLGESLIDLLNPQAGEKVLDLGCGTGRLTAEIAARGAMALGLDASPQMIEAAKQDYPSVEFCLADGAGFDLGSDFDAIFSNAALHWVKPPAEAAKSMAHALKPGGRLVFEMGGKRNVSRIEAALMEVGQLNVSPWYFPSLAEYGSVLEAAGLEVVYGTLYDRPTPLEGPEGMKNWVRMFGSATGLQFNEDQLQTIEDMARPHLWDGEKWVADYRRLRAVAVKV